MRYKSLDAVRGLACLIVVFYHVLMLFNQAPSLVKYSPLRLLTAGSSAVFVFFILSGFVLTFSLNAHVSDGYISFAVKRFIRIYLPFAVAIVFSAALWYIVEPRPLQDFSEWAQNFTWQVKPTASVILGHLAMTDLERLHSLDNVMWSLVVELRLSLLFPLIAALVTWNWQFSLLGSLLFSACCIYLGQTFPTDSWPIDPFETGSFLYLFVIGAVIAQNHEGIEGLVNQCTPTYKVLAWCLGLVLFSINPAHLGGFPTAAGATLVISLCLGRDTVAKTLATPIPLWLGKISYSLYLVHLPIIFTAINLWSEKVNVALLLSCAVLVSMGLSFVMHHAVEVPAIHAGRRAASWIRGAAGT